MRSRARAHAGAERGRGSFYGWAIVALCVATSTSPNALPVNCFSLFLRGWSHDLHAPISTFHLGILALGFGTALLSPLAGSLIDRLPARPLLLVGLGGTALLHLGIGSATATWQYLLLYAGLLPMALVLCGPLLTNALVARWFVGRVGFALALAAAGPGIASIVLPPIVAVLIPRFGWRAVWHGGGLLVGLVVLPLVLAVAREPSSGRAGRAPAPSGGDRVRLREVLASRSFWLLVVGYLPMLGLYNAFGANIAPLAAARGFGPEAAGLFLSLVGLAHVGSMLLVGAVSDRLGTRLPWAALAAASGVGSILFAYGDRLVVLAIAVVLTSCGGSFWPLLGAAIARRFGRRNVGRVFGLATFFLPVTALAPFGLARTQELTGSYTPALVALGLLAILGAGVCALMMRDPAAAPPAPGAVSV